MGRKYPSRAKTSLIRILRSLIAQGLETVQRKRLRGSLNSRLQVLARAQAHLNLVRQSGEAKEWTGGSVLNSVVSECRKIAESPRVECSLRLRNVEYLMQAAGFLPAIEGDSTSDLIKSVVDPSKKAEPAAKVETDIEAALRKYREGRS